MKRNKFVAKAAAIVLAICSVLCLAPFGAVAAAAVEKTQNQKLALEVVHEGMVLLKNKNGALPLASSDTVALFGKGQICEYDPDTLKTTTNAFQLGGYGSGQVELYTAPKAPADAFLEANKKGEIGMYKPLTEAYQADLNYTVTDAMYTNADNAANTAVMVISRYAKEGSDVTEAEWSLTADEQAMLQKISTLFDKVVVVLNVPFPISVEWAVDGNSQGIDVDAVLLAYLGGENAAEGIVNVLLGKVNPSGKLVDTIAKSISDYPTTATFLESDYTVRYTEDIYVGYRYFETFAKDKVVYPFGYGLSYTTFSMTTDSVVKNGDTVTVTVTVKNTGSVAGKEVVEVYCSAPQAGEGSAVLSKSAIELTAYAKTKLLAPNESETLTLTFLLSDMASFDDTGISGHKSAYVLEAGEYDVLVGNSVRSAAKVKSFNVTAATVVEQLSALCPTNLDKRLKANGTYENLTATNNTLKWNVKSDAVTWIEAEDAYALYSTVSKKVAEENFSETGAFFYNGTEWQSALIGKSIGNFNNATGGTCTYRLQVDVAGTYKMGYIKANGSGSDVAGVLDVLVSSDGGQNWTKQSISIDAENTKNAGTGSTWFNFKYYTQNIAGSDYQVTLPAGEVLLRFETAKYTGSLNIDKFVMIPAGCSCTLSDVVSTFYSKEGLTVSNYQGIKYADVLAGRATMDAFLSQMSYEELIDLCFGHTASVYGSTGVIGFSSDASAAKYGVYSADTADGPAGLRLNKDICRATFFPVSILQASTWNVELIEKVGEAIGGECLQYQADIWLAPGLNIHRNPLCGRNFEYYSEDPLVSGKMAAAMVKGVQSRGVACAIKHFAVNGKETHRKRSDSRVSEKALREIYLRGFEIAIEESSPMCVMTSYNLVNGLHASVNNDLIMGILRGEWGFDGLIMSDWNTSPTITDEVNAGNNVTMPSGEAHILGADVKLGAITRDQLEENATYIIKTLVKLPDHTVRQTDVHSIAVSGKTTVPFASFSARSVHTALCFQGDDYCMFRMNALDAGGKRGFAEFKVSVTAPGLYELSFDYAADAAVNDAFKVSVNGTEVHLGKDSFSATNGNTRSLVAGNVSLPAGESVIFVQHLSSADAKYVALSLTAKDVVIPEADEPGSNPGGGNDSEGGSDGPGEAAPDNNNTGAGNAPTDTWMGEPIGVPVGVVVAIVVINNVVLIGAFVVYVVIQKKRAAAEAEEYEEDEGEDA